MINEVFSIASEFSVLAQTSGVDGMTGILKQIRAIAYILAVVAVIASAYQLYQGRIDNALFGAAAAGLIGFSAVLTKILFEATGDELDFIP